MEKTVAMTHERRLARRHMQIALAMGVPTVLALFVLLAGGTPSDGRDAAVAVIPAAANQAALTPVSNVSATGVVRGTVLDAESGTPLWGVTVTARELETGQRQSVVTDEDGMFAFGDLVFGRYALIAAKAGFVPAVFGADVGRSVGATLVVDHNQAKHSISIGMFRGSTVAGTLEDKEGRPVG